MGCEAHGVTLSRETKSPVIDKELKDTGTNTPQKNILEYTGSDEGWFLSSPSSQSFSLFSASCATKVTVYAAC